MLFGLSRELKDFQEKVRQIARAEIEPHAAERTSTRAAPQPQAAALPSADRSCGATYRLRSHSGTDIPCSSGYKNF